MSRGVANGGRGCKRKRAVVSSGARQVTRNESWGFSGGEIVIRHHEEKVVFRGSGKGLGMIAFYADCHHEVRPDPKGRILPRN